MIRRTSTLFIIIIACTASVALAEQSPAAQPAPVDSMGSVHIVSGHADVTSIPFEQVVVDQYSFAAIRKSNGEVHGEFEFRAKYAGLVVRVHGSVECVTVSGNKARVGGRVRHSTFDAIPAGSMLTWSVTDNGEGGKAKPDTASAMLGVPDAEAYCEFGLPYPETALRRGNIQVR